MMDETDSTFMKRALELARRGAGLVSPNPMVGAVLVSEGRVIGEGFHRYDKLRHAESYAIEMAGELARGATLYCSLEPCCHHGRTPPCTNALIEAGIARAIISTRDPDPRVSGHGIDQLRATGISVEVGLCESEALRLNESYLKFVTSGVPFIHSVVECIEAGGGSIRDWKPSREFLESAFEYDLIGLGHDARINKTVLNACLNRERHRQLVIAGSSGDVESSISDGEQENTTIIRVESNARQDGHAQPGLVSLLEPLADRLNVTSALTLPGFLGIHSSSIFEQCDKLTVIIVRANKASSANANRICSGIELDIEDAHNIDVENYTESTGYPRRSRQE
jgi:pyrimidine deaminase RibD-like protein